jgi:hypothetical protein
MRVKNAIEQEMGGEKIQSSSASQRAAANTGSRMPSHPAILPYQPEN